MAGPADRLGGAANDEAGIVRVPRVVGIAAVAGGAAHAGRVRAEAAQGELLRGMARDTVGTRRCPFLDQRLPRVRVATVLPGAELALVAGSAAQRGASPLRQDAGQNAAGQAGAGRLSGDGGILLVVVSHG